MNFAIGLKVQVSILKETCFNLCISAAHFVVNILTNFPVMFNEENFGMQTCIGKAGSHRPNRESAPTILKSLLKSLLTYYY